MKIKYIVWIILTILIILFGIFTYRVKNVDYGSVVDDALDAYYVNSDLAELDEILYFMDDYSFHVETIDEVQKYVNKKVNDWYEFLDNKYVCTIDDNLACNILFNEFSNLNSKLVVMNEKVSEKGFKLMNSDDFDKIYDQAANKINDLRILINYLDNKDNANYVSYCDIAICDYCTNGVCNCIYYDEYMNSYNIVCEAK